MAWRNVGILTLSVATVSVAFVLAYSAMNRSSTGSVEIQPVEAPAWQVQVEDLSPVEDEAIASVAGTNSE